MCVSEIIIRKQEYIWGFTNKLVIVCIKVSIQKVEFQGAQSIM